MFVVNGKVVYQITRESATDSLRSAIRKKLNTIYNTTFLTKVVDEIMQCVAFPEVMDHNDVYICNNDGIFMRYILHPSGILATDDQYEVSYFKPTYKGPEVDQILDVLAYSTELLFSEQKTYENAMIVQADADKYFVTSMVDDVKGVIAKKIGKFLSEEESIKISNEIIGSFFSDSILIAGLRRKRDISYYSLGADYKCRRINIFDVDELYKKIMGLLPHLEVISQEAKKAAIYLHNYILYGYEIQDYELRNPYRFDGNDAIFKRTIDGIDFYLYPSLGVWVSDYIRCNTKQIVYSSHTPASRDYNSRESFSGGTYKGFPIFYSRDEVDREIGIYSGRTEVLSEDIRILMDATKYIEDPFSSRPWEYFEFTLATIPSGSYKRKEFNYDNVEVYLRVTIK